MHELTIPPIRLFHPTAPPKAEPFWKHFASRDSAMAYCCEAWPIPTDHMDERLRGLFFTIPVEVPLDDPKAEFGFWRVYDHVVSLCAPEARAQLVKKSRRKPAQYQKVPPIVTACAADAAQALRQLYTATQTGILYDARREKWEPFALGYGCLGYYNAQAITYEPPPELDGRLTVTIVP